MHAEDCRLSSSRSSSKATNPAVHPQSESRRAHAAKCPGHCTPLALQLLSLHACLRMTAVCHGAMWTPRSSLSPAMTLVAVQASAQLRVLPSTSQGQQVCAQQSQPACVPADTQPSASQNVLPCTPVTAS
jgi:hypothetical protein